MKINKTKEAAIIKLKQSAINNGYYMYPSSIEYKSVKGSFATFGGIVINENFCDASILNKGIGLAYGSFSFKGSVLKPGYYVLKIALKDKKTVKSVFLEDSNGNIVLRFNKFVNNDRDDKEQIKKSISVGLGYGVSLGGGSSVTCGVEFTVDDDFACLSVATVVTWKDSNGQSQSVKKIETMCSPV